MLKEQTLDEKIEEFKKYITTTDEVDNFSAFNMFLLIKGNHAFNEDFFNNENVVFNDTAEFIDIKDAIRTELKGYIENLLGIYMSCFTHCTTHDEKIVKEIPSNYKKVLFLLDFQTIGKLFKSNSYCGESVLYKDSFDVVYSFSRQFMMYADLINKDTFDYGDIS